MNQVENIRYCSKCVMPETKPDLFIDDEGVCNACRAYENRSVIDWDTRKSEFIEIIHKITPIIYQLEKNISINRKSQVSFF